MTTQAKPPSKRERPMKLNMGAKNLKQTVKNVIKEKKAQHKMLMMRDKNKRGRPSGAMNPTKKRLVAARYAQETVRDANLEQQREQKIKDMKARILKNQEAAKKAQEEAKLTGIDKRGNMAAGVLKPTLSAPQPPPEPTAAELAKEEKRKAKLERKANKAKSPSKPKKSKSQAPDATDKKPAAKPVLPVKAKDKVVQNS